MTPSNSPKAWLESDDPELVATIVADIERHISTLRSSGDTFYGYAILPGDYRTQPDPATLTVAFNRESDIAQKNANDPVYRYSVYEWKNYVHEGFEASESKLRSSLEHFRSLHSRKPGSSQIDDCEIAFVAKINRAILGAMLELKRKGTIGEDTFAVVWLPDSHDEIVDKSAMALNKPTVYKQFASLFK